MFKEVKKVELELSSYCNRKCAWCPNKYIDRTFKKDMPKDLLVEILQDLKENNFGDMSVVRDKLFLIARFSEPMADIDLLIDRTNIIKSYFPNIRISINTNGDYLENIKGHSINIDNISIMDYDCIGIKQCNRRLESIGASIISVEANVIRANYKDILGRNIEIKYFTDWTKNIELEDRGGFLKQSIIHNNTEMIFRNNRAARLYSCNEPKIFIAIEHNGNVTPCCHIRSDVGIHKDFVLGNLYNSKLSEIYSSDKAVKIRETMALDNHNLYPEPCKTCHKPKRKVSYVIKQKI